MAILCCTFEGGAERCLFGVKGVAVQVVGGSHGFVGGVSVGLDDGVVGAVDFGVDA